MFARVNTFQGSPENAERGLQVARETVIPAVRSIPGNVGVINLVDRATGKSIGITLWESEAALRESEQAATGVRGRAAGDSDSQIVSVERYEVADLVLETEQVAGG